MRCALWYHLYNLKNLKNTHGRVLVSVKLQASACNFTNSNTPPWVFFTFFKLYKWYQIAQRTRIVLIGSRMLSWKRVRVLTKWKFNIPIQLPCILVFTDNSSYKLYYRKGRTFRDLTLSWFCKIWRLQNLFFGPVRENQCPAKKILKLITQPTQKRRKNVVIRSCDNLLRRRLGFFKKVPSKPP